MKLKLWTPALLAVAMMLGNAAVAQASTVADASSTWDGLSSIGQFGEPSIATWGQTFTVADSNTTLSAYSFRVKDQVSEDPIDFKSYILAWDSINMKATGPALYESSTQVTSGGGVFEVFTFNPGGLMLSEGQQYIAVLSSSGFFNGNNSSGDLGFNDANVYAGGGAWILDNGNDFSKLTIDPWDDLGGDDLAFDAVFSGAATPEPATLAMFGLGGGVIGLTLRRRRQA